MVYQRTSCDLRYAPDAPLRVRSEPTGRTGHEIDIAFGSDLSVYCTSDQARQLAADILDALGGTGGTRCALCGGSGHFDDVECPRCGATGVAK